jgi:hypothetical protein
MQQATCSPSASCQSVSTGYYKHAGGQGSKRKRRRSVSWHGLLYHGISEACRRAGRAEQALRNSGNQFTLLPGDIDASARLLSHHDQDVHKLDFAKGIQCAGVCRTRKALSERMTRRTANGKATPSRAEDIPRSRPRRLEAPSPVNLARFSSSAWVKYVAIAWWWLQLPRGLFGLEAQGCLKLPPFRPFKSSRALQRSKFRV